MSEIETKVVAASFNANQELEDNGIAMALVKIMRRKKQVIKPTCACVPQTLLVGMKLASGFKEFISA